MKLFTMYKVINCLFMHILYLLFTYTGERGDVVG